MQIAIHCLLLTTCAAVVNAQTVAVSDLAIPGGRPQAINDEGDVVGWFTQGSTTRAFLHSAASGTYADIGTLPGMSHAAARGINTLGQIVGSSWPTVISQPGRAFRYTPGVGMVDLGLLSGPTSEAYCIDDLGNVGGRADGTAFTPEAFYQSAGHSMQAIVPGTSGTTHDITASGWRVGVLGNNQAFYVQPAGSVQFIPLPAATPLGRATSVSESGWIAGEMSDPSGSPSYAFRFDVATGVVENLGSISRYGTVTGIDGRGTVVAIRQISSQSTPLALISFNGAQLVAIDSLLAVGSAWSVRTVSGINEHGQMCGRAALGTSGTAPVRLDPIAPTSGSTTAVGGGCSPIRVGAGALRAGRSWRLAMRGAAPGQFMFSMLTIGHYAGTPFPGSPCDLYLSASSPVVATFAVANAIGQWATTHDIPAHPAIAGTDITHQLLVAEPASALGLVATEATQTIAGN